MSCKARGVVDTAGDVVVDVDHERNLVEVNGRDGVVSDAGQDSLLIEAWEAFLQATLSYPGMADLSWNGIVDRHQIAKLRTMSR